MRSQLKIFGIGLGLSLSLISLSAQAQSEQQSTALVEALRQAASQGKHDGLYSEWQVKTNNIPRWSRFCFGRGREITPEQFEANPTIAREMLTCIIRDALKEEIPLAGNDETVAVRRVAAWWMTGDANRYASADLAPYLQKVVGFYQSQNQATVAPTVKPTAPSAVIPATPPVAPPIPVASAKPPVALPIAIPAPVAPAKPSVAPPIATAPTAAGRLSVYDRYMKAGYAATAQKLYSTALRYFRRALDEHPNDSYSMQAIRNIESLQRDKNFDLAPQTAPSNRPPAAPAPFNSSLQATRSQTRQ